MSTRAIKAEISLRNLDPKVAYRNVDKSGRLVGNKKSETTSSFQEVNIQTNIVAAEMVVIEKELDNNAEVTVDNSSNEEESQSYNEEQIEEAKSESHKKNALKKKKNVY